MSFFRTWKTREQPSEFTKLVWTNLEKEEFDYLWAKCHLKIPVPSSANLNSFAASSNSVCTVAFLSTNIPISYNHKIFYVKSMQRVCVTRKKIEEGVDEGERAKALERKNSGIVWGGEVFFDRQLFPPAFMVSLSSPPNFSGVNYRQLEFVIHQVQQHMRVTLEFSHWQG